MRRLLSVEILILAVIAAGALVMAAGSANPAEAADQRPCVTRSEHAQIERGMTKRRVDRLVDFPGVRSQWWARTWLYIWCNGESYTAVTYTPPKPRRVVEKIRLTPDTATP